MANPDPTLIGGRNRPDEHWSVTMSCFYLEPMNHLECNYEPKSDPYAICVKLIEDRICVDYFCRIGAKDVA